MSARPLTEAEAEAFLYGHGLAESRVREVELYPLLRPPESYNSRRWWTYGIVNTEQMRGPPPSMCAEIVKWCAEHPSPLHTALLVVAARRALERL